MKIPRVSMITLGVADLIQSTKFYEAVLSVSPTTSYEGVTFIELQGTWLALYPAENLATDISADISASRNGFSGFTLAHNVRNKEDVISVIERAKLAGAGIVKEPQDTFWGGFSGYFKDLDGYYWEIAWGPMFEFTENGEMRFKASA